MNRDDEFRRKRKRGEIMERRTARWLGQRDASVLPVYDFSGLADDKPPRLIGKRLLVMPDLLVCKDGRSYWLEVKLKVSATLHRKSGVLETGLSRRLCEQYLQVQKLSGLDVYLLFAHEKEDEVRIALLSTLWEMRREYRGTKMGWAGMAFFPYYKIPKVCTVGMLPAIELRLCESA